MHHNCAQLLSQVRRRWAHCGRMVPRVQCQPKSLDYFSMGIDNTVLSGSRRVPHLAAIGQWADKPRLRKTENKLG